MNSTNTNVGGWEASEMRTYANEAFFNNLPEDLRNVITKTKVISGHGSGDNNAEREDGNWESTDNIYLLSGKEVLDVNSYDTAYDKTRQLDYYADNHVTTSKNRSYAIKKNINGNASAWWLRAASSDDTDYFLCVFARGSFDTDYATNHNGFAPAFRIG